MKNNHAPVLWAIKMIKESKRTLSSALVISSIIVLAGCGKEPPSDTIRKAYYPPVIDVVVPEPFEFIDPRDGMTYQAARIGDQTWMIQNLAYLPSVSPSSDTSSTERHYYVYGNEDSSVEMAKAMENYARYGVLYNWEAARISCPSGWHLPSDEEWTVLTDYLIQSGYGYGSNRYSIGKAMASVSGWDITSDFGTVGNIQSNNNGSRFNAIPAGMRVDGDHGGVYVGLGYNAGFWSSTEMGSTGAWGRSLEAGSDEIAHMGTSRIFGLTVRCVKDIPQR
jgi:uncharacterized protein (TIGR02145 family)